MARCPDCNKFVGYDDSVEPEVQDESIEDETIISQVRVVLACSECGTELKETYLDFEIPIEHECDPKDEPEEPRGEDEERYEIDNIEAEFQDRLETTTKTGKPIKNPRYMKRFYGADLKVSVKCKDCGEVFDLSETQDQQASFFDELT